MHSERVRDPFAFLLPCRGSLQKSECLHFAYRHLNTNQRFLSLFPLQRAFPPSAFFLLILVIFLVIVAPIFHLSYLFNILVLFVRYFHPLPPAFVVPLLFYRVVFGIDRLIYILDQRSALSRLETNVKIYVARGIPVKRAAYVVSRQPVYNAIYLSVGKLQLRPRHAFMFLVIRISRCHAVLYPVFPACETILRRFYRVYRLPSTRFIRCESGNCARAPYWQPAPMKSPPIFVFRLFLAYSPLLSCPNPPEKKVQEKSTV